MGNVPQVNVCLYDLTRCDGRLVMDVLKTHPRAMVGTMVVDNPYYLRPDDFLAEVQGQG
jgi:non-homologous end joining protein Ku